MIETAVIDEETKIIKRLKPENEDEESAQNEIESELYILQSLHHPNVISLHGAGRTTKSNYRFLVTEMITGGTLTATLYELICTTYMTDKLGYNMGLEKKKLTYSEGLNLAKQIAEAMDYCHRDADKLFMILHRDLKPDNICLTSDGNVKIIDFGYAKKVKASTNTNEVFIMSGMIGTTRYMAPEVAKSEPYNQKVDVYSFGVILFELMTQEKAFGGINGKREFKNRVVNRGERPAIPNEVPARVVTLIKNCWSYNANERPDFNEIVDILDTII